MTTPEQFLKILWGDPPPGTANIFVLPPRYSYWSSEFSTIDRYLESHHHEEVYTGVALAAREGGPFTSKNRVKEATAAAIAGVWADIDVAHPIHKKSAQLPPSIEQAMDALAKLPYEPTLIVDSGHGLQYWWLFEKPWVFADQEEWAQGRRITQWWHRLVQELFKAQGWTTDSVFDLARIMRVPGTFNNKVSGERKPVVTIKTDGPRYVVDDLLGLVPPDFVASPPVAERTVSKGSPGKNEKKPKATAASIGLVLQANAQPSPVRLDTLLKLKPKFKATWEKNRPDMTDQSASAYEMSIANHCVRAEWPDQEVVDAMIYWRVIHGEDLKLREDYYQGTLDEAKRSIAEIPHRPTVDPTAKTSQREEPVGESVSYPKEQRQKVMLMKDEGLNIEACIHAVKHSNNPPTLFSISDGQGIGVLTSVQGRAGMEICTGEQTHLEIARRVRFVRPNRRLIEESTVPSVTLMNLVHLALRPELPRFNGFKRLPFLWGGALVASPGYHSESGYYVDVPADLDLDLSVESALATIDEFFEGFPFQGPADKANALSVILGFPLKPLGRAPGLFADKPTSQTGASLLCRSLGTIIEGAPPAMVTQGKSIGELDKRLITKLKDQPTVIILDNLNRELDSDMVASGMTDDYFGGRLLGNNRDALVPTKSLTLMFTGKNLTATRELLNRSLRCRLDAGVPRPETLTHFGHTMPDAMLTNRVAIVSAVSSIIQRWIDAGMPRGEPVLGSFIEYTKALSGLMKFMDMPGFDGNRSLLLIEATPSWENLDTLILRWWEQHETLPVRAADLVELADDLDLKGETERSRATSLTRRLSHALGQVFEVDDEVLVKLIENGRDAKGRAKQGLGYRLMRMNPRKDE